MKINKKFDTLLSFQLLNPCDSINPLKSPLIGGKERSSGGSIPCGMKSMEDTSPVMHKSCLIQQHLPFNHCMQGLQTSIQLLSPDTTIGKYRIKFYSYIWFNIIIHYNYKLWKIYPYIIKNKIWVINNLKNQLSDWSCDVYYHGS